MKHYLALLILTAFTLQACSKSEKTEKTIPNKLTKIILSKNNNLESVASINYNTDGEIAILVVNGLEYRYSYENDLIIMYNANGDYQNIKYYLNNNNLILKKEEQAVNEYTSDVYVKNEYTFRYERLYLNATALVVRSPRPGGGYDTDGFSPLNSYEMVNENIVKYSYMDQKVVYTYGTMQQPDNFPFRIIDSFYPYEIDFFLPINYWFGKFNKNLPEKAEWSFVLPSTVGMHEYVSTYTFEYNLIGDYITGMKITEKITNKDGESPMGDNVYELSFEYNYKVSQ